MSEMRWDPFLEEWVVSSTHRSERPLLPEKSCPLCPGVLEVAKDYQIVVFENRYPSFYRHPPMPDVESRGLFKAASSQGVCEVVLYTSQHDLSLADLPQGHIFKLIEAWRDRYCELGNLPYVDYVYIFENKGEVIGVTLSHPHGQIYAFPFIPPKISRELAIANHHFARKGKCLYCSHLEAEIADGERIVLENNFFVVSVPFFARYPYETRVYPRRHLGSLEEISGEEAWGMSLTLKELLNAYDSLFGYSFPYIMSIYQSPTDGARHEYFHLHIDFYPPMRAADKQKIPAGCEVGTGTFLNDTAPEAKAKELRDALHRWREKRDGR